MRRPQNIIFINSILRAERSALWGFQRSVVVTDFRPKLDFLNCCGDMHNVQCVSYNLRFGLKLHVVHGLYLRGQESGDDSTFGDCLVDWSWRI